MPRPAQDTTQVALRIPTEWVKEFDDLARLMSKPGVNLSRSDALRAALHRGLLALRAEHGPAMKGAPGPARKPVK